MSSKKTETNKLLLIQFGKGNRKAFRKLFELYWEPMFINAKSIVVDENVAQDIVQEVWIKLWQQRDSSDIRNFEAYIFRAVQNGCFKYYRDKKFDRLQLNVIESIQSASEPEITKHYDLEETQQRIRQSLNVLPLRCRQIFELSRMEQYSNEEIALYLGISKRSVENQLSRAIRLVRHNLTLLLFYLIQ
ncbi:RNA polymerase sigma-70 factor [Arenibacter sp. ARW7G5Y1]|uniref:RNA polymerase sigma-70 factor n=1 Tax=Arenibacter sp. ARW7G5Y1 TaxID=2135619 RepID=UPI000D752F98|nr:RNA polymerase sigma-70 factor [Arenibacter sp. ARW7G5Y1]PXX21841.1 RNA polymerase sigma-70 factor (ECF subfamily) [Arenibacter sp. ARW7G5Y1]